MAWFAGVQNESPVIEKELYGHMDNSNWQRGVSCDGGDCLFSAEISGSYSNSQSNSKDDEVIIGQACRNRKTGESQESKMKDDEKRKTLEICIRDMLDDIERGPDRRKEREHFSTYQNRLERFYATKMGFAGYCIRLLRELNGTLADFWLEHLDSITR